MTEESKSLVTTEPISLNEYRFTRELANSNALPADWHLDFSLSSETGSGSDVSTGLYTGGVLSAGAVLRKLNPDTELGRFFDVTSQAIQTFQACLDELSLNRNLAADEKILEARQLLGQLFILREISDAIGVIVLAALESTSRVVAITDAPELPDACIAALMRLWAAPFMDFAEAVQFAQTIRDKSETKTTEEFAALVNELLAAQTLESFE